MFNRKMGFAIVAVLLSVVLVLSGCTKSKSPKDALQASMTKSSEIKSYNFKGSLKIEDLDIPEDAMAEEGAAQGVNMLKNAEMSWTGAYKSDPMTLELNLQLALKGDLAITFNVPIIMTQEKVWVKVPNIPMLPIPEDIIGKFVELDLKKLAEDAGQEMPSMDIGKSQQFSNDLMGIIFKHIDEKQYLSDIKAEDAGIPDSVDAKQVVQFHVDQTQIEPFVNTVIEKIAPEVIDLLSKNEEYRKLFQITQEDLDTAKKELADADKGEIKDGLAEMKKELKKLDIKANIGIDKNEFPIYTDATIAANVESEELTGGVTLRVVSEMSNINKEVKFENEIPSGDNVITMDELEELTGGMFGAGLEDFDDGSLDESLLDEGAIEEGVTDESL
ncbi:hypothetical protein ACFPPD_20395 [Cohnella suwonensis]|uniref:Lipoprotein n=1 Tax=Cohnella suwonensis TaxID=696072 RepID=A0ABW0M2B6_9BACL